MKEQQLLDYLYSEKTSWLSQNSSDFFGFLKLKNKKLKGLNRRIETIKYAIKTKNK